MQFIYTAINKDGKEEKDQIEATSAHEAAALLHSRGLLPTSIIESRERLARALLGKFGGVSLNDKILFIQNLSVMLKAGIALAKSLKILAAQTKNPKFQIVLENIYQNVEQGQSIAGALAKYPEIFSNIFVSMVRVGEVSGTLDNSLQYLTIQLQREHNLISRTKGAMIYPAVIVFAMLIVGILMSIFVLPNLISIFKDANIALPLATRIVIGIVDFMSGHTLLALMILGGLVLAVLALLKTVFGQNLLDIVMLRTPVLGEIDKKINMARFCRITSSMLKGGTPILEAMEVASESLGNHKYRDASRQAAADIRLGKTLSSSLAKQPRLFSYLVVQMVAVGDESGTVETILEELATRFEEEVDETMRNISSVIEPLLILVIGAVVGLLAVALIGPIYSLTQQAAG